MRGGLSTGKIAPTYRLHRWRAQQKDSGDCFSSPRPKVTQLSPSLCVSGALQAVTPLLKLEVSACKLVSLCGPFKGMSGFIAAFYFTWTDGITMDCHSQMWDLLFLALNPWAWEPFMGLEPIALQVGSLQLRYLSLTATCRCEARSFHVSAPTSLDVASSFYP